MAKPPLLLKIAALSSSLILMVSFVAYRSGAFDGMSVGGHEINVAAANFQAQSQQQQTNRVDSPPPRLHVMPSSKSGRVYEPPRRVDTANIDRIMPSSKSAPVFERPKPRPAPDQGVNKEAPPAPNQAPPSKGKMPPSNSKQDQNSKSNSESQEPQQQMPDLMPSSKSGGMFKLSENDSLKPPLTPKPICLVCPSVNLLIENQV